jgi:hypothetical protein
MLLHVILTPCSLGLGAITLKLPLLREFSDVLRSEIPGGLPPQRFAADGRAIEHCIETADGEQPYARNPMPFTAEEEQEIRKYIQDFLDKGWIVPSLSPWAAPVLFVPKKVDPVKREKHGAWLFHTYV